MVTVSSLLTDKKPIKVISYLLMYTGTRFESRFGRIHRLSILTANILSLPFLLIWFKYLTFTVNNQTHYGQLVS